MKKYLITVVTILALLLGLGASSFALSEPYYVGDSLVDPLFRLSEDQQTLYYGEQSYQIVDASSLEVWLGTEYDLILSENQRQTIKRVSLNVNAEKTVVEASIQYQTGSQLICTFLRSDCMDDYWDVMTDDGVYEVEFGWPENNVVIYDRAGFYGEAQTLSDYVYEWGDRYEVYKTNTNLSRIVGGLIVSDGNYYYVDYAENQTDYANFYNLEEVQGYLITDHELIDRLDAGVGAYYQEDIGFLYDDSLSQRVTAVMLCVLFGAIPLGILIFALIQTIRKKGAYRKMFAFITAFSAAELAVFTVVAILIGMNQ